MVFSKAVLVPVSNPRAEACNTPVLNASNSSAIEPLSVLVNNFIVKGLDNKNLPTYSPAKVGNAAIGANKILAPIPAATIPPAPAPLPTSPLVAISIVFASCFKLCVVSLPNIASKVSSPYLVNAFCKFPGLNTSVTFPLPLNPKSIESSRNFIKLASFNS